MEKNNEPTDRAPDSPGKKLSLADAVFSVLQGIPAVSPRGFIHIAQRLVLANHTDGGSTVLALKMGRPGLELEEANALEIPEEVPEENAAKLKEALASVSDLMRQVKMDAEQLVRELEKDGRVPVPQETAIPAPDSMTRIIMDEAAALILVGAEEAVEDDLDLVVAGLSNFIGKSNDPNAVNLALTLVERLPHHKDLILERLQPCCSESQWNRLYGG
jgi:hypothetical protein